MSVRFHAAPRVHCAAMQRVHVRTDLCRSDDGVTMLGQTQLQRAAQITGGVEGEDAHGEGRVRRRGGMPQGRRAGMGTDSNEWTGWVRWLQAPGEERIGTADSDGVSSNHARPCHAINTYRQGQRSQTILTSQPAIDDTHRRTGRRNSGARKVAVSTVTQFLTAQPVRVGEQWCHCHAFHPYALTLMHHLSL